MQNTMLGALIVCLLACALTAQAQQDGWCGYALIEGLPIARNQIGIFELITPARTRESRPDELFQTRYSLDFSKVIIEGCFKVLPGRELVKYLLTLVGIDPLQVDLLLTYSIFMPNGTRAESAASVRFYLQQNINEWQERER